MALLAQLGAEKNSGTDEMEQTLNSGTVSINSTSPMSGLYDYRCNPSASTGFWRQHLFGSNQTTIGYLRVRIKVATRPGTTIQILRFSNASNAHLASIRLTSTGTLTLNNAANTQVGSASAALTNGTEYVIELMLNGNATSSALDARINGVSFASGNNSSVGSWARILWGAITPNSTCDIKFDDVIINDNSGSSETSWPDSTSRLIALNVDSAGDSNQFADTSNSAGTSSNYTLVDENTPNDATDYIQSGTLNDIDDYNIADSGLTSGDTIKAVTVHSRYSNDTADATTAFKIGIAKASGGTYSESAAIVPNSTTWRTDDNAVGKPALVTYTDPDGAAWTNTTLDSMHIRAKITAANVNKIRVSALWAYVQYVPGVAPTDSYSGRGVGRGIGRGIFR